MTETVTRRPSAADECSGILPALTSHPERFVTALTERLMTYALGRGVEYYDMPAIRAITREAEQSDYRFSALILGIVKSIPFQWRSVASPSTTVVAVAGP